MNKGKPLGRTEREGFFKLLMHACFSAKGFVASKRGFLFTISVVFFASTLVVYSQSYMAENAVRERLVLMVPRQTLPAYLTDDIAFDLQQLLGFEVSVDAKASPSQIRVLLGDFIYKGFDAGERLTSYRDFLGTHFFNRIAGEQSLDMSGLLDGKTELFFGDMFRYDYDYDSNVAYFLALKNNTYPLASIDLNFDVSDDLNRMDWNSPGAGSVPISVHYVDDSNSFDFSANINPTQRSVMTLYYLDGNLQVVFGAVNANTNSILIDSNIPKRADYLLGASYSASPDNLPVFFNAVLRHTDGKLDSNTWLKLMN